MSIDALHALTLHADNVESSVTVNQRALIDKVLSRYSSENTLLRELLQNSDDANASCVKILYESSSSSSSADDVSVDIHKRMTKRVIVKNDGQIFRPEDWSRLSRIAEGNPDEAKIGAFGVGFYSVFSICEDPFVTSGGTGLAFYWRQDQLFTRRAALPGEQDGWTTFALNMRQESELPNLRNLTKFLATSLTFSRSLRNIELWLDGTNLCSITRATMRDEKIAIPSGLETTTAGKMLRIHTLETSSVRISATYLEKTQSVPQASTGSKFFSFFSTGGGSSNGKEKAKPVEADARTTSTMFLRVLTGHISSSVNRAFSTELQRATKKPPPKNTKLQLVTINAAEYGASTTTAPIFENLLTFPNQGRIFIGFPTHQTTGFAGHVGAPCIIPTVERESIDLVDQFIKVWNFEVLRAIGLLLRMAYHIEFARIKTLEEAVHTLKFFAMARATPQGIEQSIEPAFFESSNVLPISSSQGVKPSTSVRLPSPQIQFLEQTAILPEEIIRQVPQFVERLKGLGYIESISIGDIKRDLQNRTLSAAQAVAFLRYCAGISRDVDSTALHSLLGAGVIIPPGNSVPINLGQIDSYSVSKNIPDNTPLPSNCLPVTLSSCLDLTELQALAWRELSTLQWLEFVVLSSANGGATRKLDTDAEYAVLVLSVVSKNFDAMSTEDRGKAITLLRSRTCMPTKEHGMKRPDQTYFHTIKLFDDLPLILTMKGVKERFLVALGVRKTIELTYIFDRLNSGGQWTLLDLITYLASIRKDIPARDIERLKATPIANAENSKQGLTISALYEPSETLRSLGLPIIEWPRGRWKPQSEETALLTGLGLKKYPSVDALLSIASASKDINTRERALQYFTNNFVLHNYGATYDTRTVMAPFIPTEAGGLEIPRKVYSNPACALFNLPVLRKDLVGKASLLDVLPQPPASVLIHTLLQTPPQTYPKAVAQFSFMAQLNTTFSKSDIETIAAVKLIPVERDGKIIKFVQPRSCFFRQERSEPIYARIFDCVDFGHTANQFLRSIGVKDEPTSSQIAGMLVNDANNVWNICGSEDKYKQILTQIARDSNSVKRDKHLWEAMKRARFLLAYRYVPISTSTKIDAEVEADNDDAFSIQTSLQGATSIVVVDDMIFFNFFRSDIHSCPQEHYLEDLYRELGSPVISSITTDRPMTSGRTVMTEKTKQLKVEVLERLTVFLSETRAKPKRDVRDLDTNLSVVMQEKVACQREISFGTIRKSKYVEVSALALTEGRRITLVVSKNPDRYDIAVALCKVMLTSAKPGDYLLLETLLTNTLRTLKTRGYNVDRILQRQEREKVERQLQHEEAERTAAAREEEEARLKAKNAGSLVTSQPTTANGTMSNAADRGTGIGTQAIPRSPEPPRSGGFMANIRKGLGINAPPSTSGQGADERPQSRTIESNQNSQQSGQPQPSTIQANSAPVQNVTSQASINQALKKAIGMTRSSDNTSIFTPGVVDTIKEAKSFCDAKPAQDLTLAATLPNSMRFFIHRSLDATGTLESQLQPADKFSQMLSQLGRVFRVNPGSINICYDPSSPTIAFNKTGTIYCNLHFYNQLHSALPANLCSEAYTYWYVTLAHELAHNLVSEHSSEHEFYLESIIVQYLPQLVPLMSPQSELPQYTA